MWSQSELYIDLGTASTVVCDRRYGVILHEPSVLAVRTAGCRKNEPYAIGTPAKNMIEKTPCMLSVIKPLERGVIVNIENTEKMLRGFFSGIDRNHRLKNADVIISLPRVVTNFERSAVAEVVRELGARSIHLLADPIIHYPCDLVVKEGHPDSTGLPASIIGLEDTFLPKHASFKFEERDSLFMYTDGLLGNAGPKGEHLKITQLSRMINQDCMPGNTYNK